MASAYDLDMESIPDVVREYFSQHAKRMKSHDLILPLSVTSSAATAAATSDSRDVSTVKLSADTELTAEELSQPLPMTLFTYHHGQQLTEENRLRLTHLNLQLSLVKDYLKRQPYIRLFYIDLTADKIVIYSEPGTRSDIQRYLNDRLHSAEQLADFDIRDYDIEINYLLRHGEPILCAEKGACLLGGIQAEAQGSVACLGVTETNDVVLITAQHLFTEQHGRNEGQGRFLSTLNSDGVPDIVSLSYYGCLGAHDVTTDVSLDAMSRDTSADLPGVDIAVLPLKQTISKKVRSELVHTMKAVHKWEGNIEELLGCDVWKFGAITGYTEGSIVAVDVYSAGLGGQLFVVKGYGDKEFGAPGDSGSLVWSLKGVPLGIISKRVTDSTTGEVRIVCSRLDVCLDSLNARFPTKPAITELKSFRPHRHLLYKSITSPFESLSRLRQRTSLRHVGMVELADDVSVDRIRLVNNEIWCVDKRALKLKPYDVTKCSVNPVFDLDLRKIDKTPLTSFRGIIDAAQLPNGLLVVLTRHRLALRKPDGTETLIKDRCYESVQYHDHKVYALRHWDYIIDIYDLNDDTLELSQSFSLVEFQPHFQHRSFIVLDDWICFINENQEACFISRFDGKLVRRYKLRGVHEPVICHSDSHGAVLIQSRGKLFVLHCDGAATAAAGAWPGASLTKIASPLGKLQCVVVSALLVNNQLYECIRTFDGKLVLYSTTLHETEDNTSSAQADDVTDSGCGGQVASSSRQPTFADLEEAAVTSLQDEMPWLKLEPNKSK